MVKNLIVKGFNKAKSGVNKVKTLALTAAIGTYALAGQAKQSFAANADLDTVTSSLTDGATDMKTNFLTITAVVIPIIILVFGITWLILNFKKKMSKA